jgi:acyl-CoA synthetase (NDP forming)
MVADTTLAVMVADTTLAVMVVVAGNTPAVMAAGTTPAVMAVDNLVDGTGSVATPSARREDGIALPGPAEVGAAVGVVGAAAGEVGVAGSVQCFGRFS